MTRENLPEKVGSGIPIRLARPIDAPPARQGASVGRERLPNSFAKSLTENEAESFQRVRSRVAVSSGCVATTSILQFGAFHGSGAPHWILLGNPEPIEFAEFHFESDS